MPTNVSFSRIEIREESAKAVADGYYKRFNGAVHPPTPKWLRPHSGYTLIDRVGTEPPGLSGPFSAGTFVWAIPQTYRPLGSGGAGVPYITAMQTQVMTGISGAETTSKEGASTSRTPFTPAPAPGVTPPSPPPPRP
jgi:hypothetical protein